MKKIHNNQIAVSLYLYYTDLWLDFYELLSPLKQHIKLYLTLSYDTVSSFDHKYLEEFDHQLFYHNNYGADVAPFLNHLSSISEPTFIKIHSKKSLWGFKRHINWRELLLYNLLGSESIFHDNMIKMTHNDNGVLCNEHLLFKNRELKNVGQIQKVCNILNMDYNIVKNGYFMAGNMFWGNTSLFQKSLLPYLNDINSLLFSETGKINDDFHGTYCHAMERILGYIVSFNDKKFVSSTVPTLKVLNSEAPNGTHFNMAITHKNSCYLLEDPNVYGKIQTRNHETISIKWTHLTKLLLQDYRVIDQQTIEKI
jgi:lipopolysaccharide biosynthesis protein